MKHSLSYLLCICFLGLLLLLPLSAQEEAPSLRSLMSPQEFERAGLDKLSAAELEFLARWHAGLVDEVREDTVRATVAAEDQRRQQAQEEAEALIPKGEDAFGFEQLTERVSKIFKTDQKRIESMIPGEFRGWRGETTFRLANGQVWRQTERDTFSINVENPTVFISRGTFGTYFLRVKGFGSRVKVERIK